MSLLRHPAYVRFLYVRIAASIALQLQVVAVGWQMYALTDSPFDLGLIGLVQFVPAIGLFLVTGHVADRYDRRRVPALRSSPRRCAVAVLAFANATGRLTPGLLLAMAFVVGTGRAFEQPSLQSVLPNVVPADVLPRAIAGSTSASQTAVVAGPALGGILVAISPTWCSRSARCYGCPPDLPCSASPWSGSVAARAPLDLKTLFSGLTFIARQKVVLGAIAARSVRGAARQSDGAVADFRARYLPRRTAGLRRVARGARGRRHRLRAGAGALADFRPRRPHHVRHGDDLRRRHDPSWR